MADSARRHAPATARNRDPILAVLERVLPATGTVLEIACGSGEHAVYFAERLPGLVWQPSDPDPEACRSTDAWAAGGSLPNLRPAVALDVRDPSWDVGPADAVVCINMIHISPWESCLALLRGAAACLPPGGVLFTYGPYRVGGEHTAPSNAAFDQSLRDRDPSWGVRDRDAVAAEAARLGLRLEETVEMPANNLSLVFRRSPDGDRRP
jgi:SAM-dependent methyltransferase